MVEKGMDRPDYGKDGNPGRMLITLLFFGLLSVVFLCLPGIIFKIAAMIITLFTLGIILIAAWWTFYIRVGKFRQRDAVLSLVDWKGSENVLDVGTGRGLLLIGAAKRLKHGKSIGIDIWRKQDMAGNGPEGAMLNARLEGVEDRVEIRDEDIRKTSFPDGYFDVVVSNLCLHNISSSEGRTEACREIVRILKPGGRAVISDGFHLKEYARVFESEGMLVRVLKVRKIFHKDLWLPVVIASKD